MSLKGVTLASGQYSLHGGVRFDPPKTIWAVNFPKAANADLAGTISSASIPFTYAYDSNVQRGAGTAGTDVALKVFALKKGSTKPRFVTYTLTRATGQNISFAAETDRGYVNPV